MEFGEFLRRELGSGITRAELARRFGVHPSYLNRWLSGELPSSRLCRQIAENYGMPATTILQMAGHVEESEATDPEWEVMQRELRSIYERWDRARWQDLTATIRGVASLVRPSAQSSLQSASQSSDDTPTFVGPATPGQDTKLGVTWPTRTPSLLTDELSVLQVRSGHMRGLLEDAEETLHRAWLALERSMGLQGECTLASRRPRELGKAA